MPRHRVCTAIPACSNESGKKSPYSTCFAVARVGCSVVLFSDFFFVLFLFFFFFSQTVIEVVLIYSKYISDLLIALSRSRRLNY